MLDVKSTISALKRLATTHDLCSLYVVTCAPESFSDEKAEINAIPEPKTVYLLIDTVLEHAEKPQKNMTISLPANEAGWEVIAQFLTRATRTHIREPDPTEKDAA